MLFFIISPHIEDVCKSLFFVYIPLCCVSPDPDASCIQDPQTEKTQWEKATSTLLLLHLQPLKKERMSQGTLQP